jgi:hypothetical protein
MVVTNLGKISTALLFFADCFLFQLKLSFSAIAAAMNLLDYGSSSEDEDSAPPPAPIAPLPLSSLSAEKPKKKIFLPSASDLLSAKTVTTNTSVSIHPTKNHTLTSAVSASSVSKSTSSDSKVSSGAGNPDAHTATFACKHVLSFLPLIPRSPA